ncbi:hypothetical protein DNTS_029457 [Danionella cerebrum]|uniref:OCEL domain-containing protein n=1 Tax=Danionella cerebrum TaxID=2873325 RepID=A0A553QE18_9TELE|nr:hypothetical protein DNTS_029457 [Danionella translucida]
MLQAIALVLGFIVTAALVIIMVFAIKTRQRINSHGKDNILWRRVKEIHDENSPQDVEDWVNNVNGAPGPLLADYPMKFRGSMNDLDDDSTNYDKPPQSESPPVFESMNRNALCTYWSSASQDTVEIRHNATLSLKSAIDRDVPLRSSLPLSSGSEMNSSVGRPKKRRAGRPRTTDGRDHDTDYASSGDELDDDDFFSEYPPIVNGEERDEYKRLFDQDHQEYKEIQAELDQINKRLADDAMDEYNTLKEHKRSADYQVKKKRCKNLKAKLNHVKKMVSDYDRRS